MPIDTGTSLLNAVPITSIVCASCKKETGIKKEDVINSHTLVEDFRCPLCGDKVFSAVPEKNNYGAGTTTACGGASWMHGDYSEYD